MACSRQWTRRLGPRSCHNGQHFRDDLLFLLCLLLGECFHEGLLSRSLWERPPSPLFVVGFFVIVLVSFYRFLALFSIFPVKDEKETTKGSNLSLLLQLIGVARSTTKGILTCALDWATNFFSRLRTRLKR